jgi:uncharacterized membrane protein
MNSFTRSQKAALILFILFGVVGLVDSSLIHLKEIASLTTPDAFASCKINELLDCGAVARSHYSHLFGIPVSQLGMYFYEAVAVLGICLAFGFKLLRWQVIGLSLLMLGALFFSYNLLFVSYFGIGALCIYCLVSNLSTTVVVISWIVFALPFLKRVRV